MCFCFGKNDIFFEDFERLIRMFEVIYLSMILIVVFLVDLDKVLVVEFLVMVGEVMMEVVVKKWGRKLF